VTKRISDKIFDTILQIVKRFHQEASLEDILQALVPPVPKRSLQRYLAFLVMEGQLKISGNARSRRYHLPHTESEKATPVILSQGISSAKDAHLASRQIEKLIPFSSTALSIQANVCQPIQARRPVGYTPSS
jgi:hypothetical protein